MAILTADTWQAWRGVTLTGAELTSTQLICGQVDASIKKWLKRTVERATYTDLIFDAPLNGILDLSRWAPISASGLTIYANSVAHGDPALFTSDTLLTPYTDYILTGPNSSNLTKVRSLTGWGGIFGGGSRRRQPYCLASMMVPSYGALKVTFTGGYSPVPSDIVQAACLAVSTVRELRKYGKQVGSEAWNGGSYNLPGVGLMLHGVIGTPDIRYLLDQYINYAETVG